MRGRYSKRWWRGLTKNERRILVGIMTSRSNGYGGGGYLPDDCSECGYCGEPMLGTGLCRRCYRDYETLHAKADAKLTGAPHVAADGVDSPASGTSGKEGVP